MARFEVNIVYAKMEEDGVSTYTEEYDYICFCSEGKSVKYIKEKISEMIEDEIASSEDEVLFGSADVIVRDKVQLKVTFRNRDCDPEEVEELLDLILEETDRTIH